MNRDKELAAIARAEGASRLLADVAFLGPFNEYREKVLAEWRGCPLSDPTKAETLRVSLKALDCFEDYLRALVKHGEQAQQRLNNENE